MSALVDRFEAIGLANSYIIGVIGMKLSFVSSMQLLRLAW
jgi:hypothetical protein